MSIAMNERRKDRTASVSASRSGESFWSTESNNIGLKLMKSQGWNESIGLGKNNQGTKSYIRSKYKTDSSGIGASTGSTHNQQVWSASQILYNELLQRLNSSTDTNGMILGDNKIKSDTDIELEQQCSKSALLKSYLAKRELYSKYKKSKQTSNYDITSKNEIFGTNVPAVKPEPTTTIKSEHDGNNLTTTSKLSITEYFAQQQHKLISAPIQFNAQSYYDQVRVVNDTLRSNGRIGLGYTSLSTPPALEPASPSYHNHHHHHTTNQSTISTETGRIDSNILEHPDTKKHKKHKSHKSDKHKSKKKSKKKHKKYQK